MSLHIARIVVGVVVIYAVLVLLAWAFQERLAFPAPRARLPSPVSLGIPYARSVEIVTQDSVRIRGWYFEPIEELPSGNPALLWFPGNMETVDALAPVLRELRHPQLAMLAINYRGYGDSEGRPTEDGVYLDVEAAWEFLTGLSEIDDDRIALYGRSVGAAPALHLASVRPVKAVILDSPFTSAREMAARHYRIFPRWLVRMEMNNLRRVGLIDAPVLIFHGTQDMIAPVDMGRRLAAEAYSSEFVEIEGAGHNETYDAADVSYRERMHRFLAQQLGLTDEQ